MKYKTVYCNDGIESHYACAKHVKIVLSDLGFQYLRKSNVVNAGHLSAIKQRIYDPTLTSVF